jgi:hypothetical protein
MGDSAYEYLLKTYLQTNKTELSLLPPYMEAAAGILDNLLLLSASRSLLYADDITRGKHSGKFEHLTCFLPGLLALGTYSIPSSEFPVYATADKHMAAAMGLGETCYSLYAESPLGLAADEVQFPAPSRIVKGQKPGPKSWAEEYAKWTENAAEGTDAPPGSKPLDPLTADRGREWTIRKPDYRLRPEVCLVLLASRSVLSST